MKPIPEDTRRFVRLCVPLIGFAEFDLYSTGMAQLYLDTAREQVGRDRFATFLEALAKASTPKVDGRALTPADREIARALAYLWYTGSWPRLAEAVHTGLKTGRHNEEFVVAPSSYIEGLVWRTFHGHPAGAKPPGFASWSVEPAPLPSLAEIEQECGLGVHSGQSRTSTYEQHAGPGRTSPDGTAPHLLPGPLTTRDVPPSAVPPAQAPSSEEAPA